MFSPNGMCLDTLVSVHTSLNPDVKSIESNPDVKSVEVTKFTIMTLTITASYLHSVTETVSGIRPNCWVSHRASKLKTHKGLKLDTF